MAKGPAPKPTALKKIQGNPGKRPLNKGEPRPDNRIPYCPKHLGDEAKREWRRLAKELQKMGILTYVDKAALAAYCDAWGRWVEATEAMKDEDPVLYSDKGNAYQNPQVSIVRQAMKDMLDLAKEFGMTPASRTRIKVDKGEEEMDLASQLFGVMNG